MVLLYVSLGWSKTYLQSFLTTVTFSPTLQLHSQFTLPGRKTGRAGRRAEDMQWKAPLVVALPADQKEGTGWGVGQGSQEDIVPWAPSGQGRGPPRPPARIHHLPATERHHSPSMGVLPIGQRGSGRGGKEREKRAVNAGTKDSSTLR